MRFNLFKNELIILYFLLVTIWLTSFIVSHYIQLSKFNHYDSTFELFQEKLKNLEQSSLEARDQLQKWLLINSSINTILFNHRSNLCVAILSKNRINSNRNYVIQAVMSLLTRCSFKSDFKLTLFNMEENPDMNKNALMLRNLINIENINSGIIHSNIRVKEAADYASVIKNLNGKNCTHQLILEDDAIAQNDWFNRVETIIKMIPSENKCFLVKLFTGYKFYDWNWLLFKYALLKVLFLSFIIAFTTFCINLLLTKLFQYKNTKTEFKLVLIAINSIGLIVFFNTTSTTPIKSGIREYSTGFGGVAALFNRGNSIKFALYLEKIVSDYLNGKSDFFLPKDLLIENYRQLNNLTEFIVEPSMFQHIGFHSSLYSRDLTQNGFDSMFKSYSFLDSNKMIIFKPDN